jgi:nicastrin
MEEQYYTAINVAKLDYFSSLYSVGDEYGIAEEGGPLRGIVVLANNNTSLSSPEPYTPQGQGTPSASLSVGTSYAWNTHGDSNEGGENNGGLININWYGIPTVYVRDTGLVSYLSSVATTQSTSLLSSSSSSSDNAADAAAGDVDVLLSTSPYPSILAEFNYYMGPEDITSPKCLGWKDIDGSWTPRCLPLGGNSVWSSAGSPVPVSNNNDGGSSSSSSKPTILIATGIDTTSMFHDLSPGANTAASNMLAVLMAANLIGSSVNDATLDGLYGRIVFSFFQGESYGYIGSRRFLKDVIINENSKGFECTATTNGDNTNGIVPTVYKRKEDGRMTQSCLYPLRQDLTFANLGTVRGMIAVDQIGNLSGKKVMYVQGGQATDGGAGYASFISNVMIELTANDSSNTGGYTAQASSVGQDDDGVTPLPPTPLSSLVKLSSSSVGGVVLTGYDNAYVDNSLFHSHLDSTVSSTGGRQTIDKDAIAYAATLLARTAIAAAYQDGDSSIDYATASAYALKLLPNAVDSSSETFMKLYNCLFEDGNCQSFLDYGSVERLNDASRTGIDLGMGVPLGTPPNYYVSIYDSSHGQSIVYASGKYYGSLIGGEMGDDGAPMKGYGEDTKDAVLVRPSLLEMSLFGLLNDFLGRGSFVANFDSDTLKSCKGGDDCTSVTYCDTTSSTLSVPTCAGGQCICGSRSHYHPALDESLVAATKLGRFNVLDGDDAVSAMYTEPYWSNYVGVRIYNDAGSGPGVYAISIGATFAVVCMGLVWRLKRRLVKEKVY